MTEDEAKTKWCAFSRFAFPNGATANREGEMDEMHPYMHKATRCVGSSCMMWRETDNEPVPKCQPAGSQEPVTYHAAGYCGLAGKP